MGIWAHLNLRCNQIAPFDCLNSEGLQWRWGAPPPPPFPPPLCGLGRHKKHANMIFYTIFKFPWLAPLGHFL